MCCLDPETKVVKTPPLARRRDGELLSANQVDGGALDYGSDNASTVSGPGAPPKQEEKIRELNSLLERVECFEQQHPNATLLPATFEELQEEAAGDFVETNDHVYRFLGLLLPSPDRRRSKRTNAVMRMEKGKLTKVPAKPILKKKQYDLNIKTNIEWNSEKKVVYLPMITLGS